MLPERFDFYSVFTPTNPVDFLLPWPVSDGTDGWGNTTTMVARLRDGVAIDAAQAEGAWLRIIRQGEDLDEFARLVMHADHVQNENRKFRRELSDWLRSNDDAVVDGMPGYSMGLGDFSARVAPLVVRTFDMGNGRAARDRELVMDSGYRRGVRPNTRARSSACAHSPAGARWSRVTSIPRLLRQ